MKPAPRYRNYFTFFSRKREVEKYPLDPSVNRMRGAVRREFSNTFDKTAADPILSGIKENCPVGGEVFDEDAHPVEERGRR